MTRPCTRPNSARCRAEWGQSEQRPEIVSVPVRCDYHLARYSNSLHDAARDYDVAVLREKRNLGPGKGPTRKFDLLAPEVRKRVLEFNKACIEELFREAHRIVGLHQKHWGVPGEEEGKDYWYWARAFDAAYEDCLRRVKEGTEAYKNDEMLSCYKSKERQPLAGYQVFWQWEVRGWRYPLKSMAPTQRLQHYYVPGA